METGIVLNIEYVFAIDYLKKSVVHCTIVMYNNALYRQYIVKYTQYINAVSIWPYIVQTVPFI